MSAEPCSAASPSPEATKSASSRSSSSSSSSSSPGSLPHGPATEKESCAEANGGLHEPIRHPVILHCGNPSLCTPSSLSAWPEALPLLPRPGYKHAAEGWGEACLKSCCAAAASQRGAGVSQQVSTAASQKPGPLVGCCLHGRKHGHGPSHGQKVFAHGGDTWGQHGHAHTMQTWLTATWHAHAGFWTEAGYNTASVSARMAICAAVPLS